MKERTRVTFWIITIIHVVSQCLMWIDEGYYDFRWMRDPWNWFIYLVYTSLISVLSLLSSKGYSKIQVPLYLNIMASVFTGFGGIVLLLLLTWYLR